MLHSEIRGRPVRRALAGLAIGLVPAVLAGACSESTRDFDRRQLLVDAGEATLVPGFRAFEEESGSLEDAVTAFCDGPDASGLDEARARWREARLAWKRIEFYDWVRMMDLGVWHAIDSTGVAHRMHASTAGARPSRLNSWSSKCRRVTSRTPTRSSASESRS